MDFSGFLEAVMGSILGGEKITRTQRGKTPYAGCSWRGF
jgi:hypothetical protein